MKDIIRLDRTGKFYMVPQKSEMFNENKISEVMNCYLMTQNIALPRCGITFISSPDQKIVCQMESMSYEEMGAKPYFKSAVQ